MPEGRSISEMQQKIVDDNLISAVGTNDREKIELCLKKGADINARWEGWENRTPLMIATAYSRPDLVDFILTKNPDLFAKDKNGKSVFDLCEEVSDTATKKKINRALLAALPDPQPGQAPLADDNPARDGEIAVLKPIELDHRKKSGGSFQL